MIDVGLQILGKTIIVRLQKGGGEKAVAYATKCAILKIPCRKCAKLALHMFLYGLK